MPRRKRCTSPFELMDDDFDDTSSQSSRNGNPPIQRNAANARERARMRVLSSAFGRLKTKLPNIPADTKLSKLDTLRLATMYIKQLKSVVEGGAGSPVTNSESMEGSFNNNNSNNATNCYFNLNMGVQSMNWPFGFHHLSSSPLVRSNSATSLINNNNSSNNNCCSREDQIKHLLDDTENYEHHQPQTSSLFFNHSNTNSQNNHHHHQHNSWYSETPSPELDSTSSTCLTFENGHHQHQPEEHYRRQQQQQQQQQHQLQTLNHHHPHYHNVSHVQSEYTTTHSCTFQLKHDFHHNHLTQQHQPSASPHLHQNGFSNSSNFQSTSIR